MMKRLPLTKAQFDEKRAELEALAKDWADRECTSFDEAVGQTQEDPAVGTIWTMPAIDSKRVVGLLVELEPSLGCEIPCSVIRRGGYSDRAQLVTDLLTRIRERCADDPAAVARVASPEPETAPVSTR
jgi:hypothetical protein